jgi:hypothetical protein
VQTCATSKKQQQQHTVQVCGLVSSWCSVPGLCDEVGLLAPGKVQWLLIKVKWRWEAAAVHFVRGGWRRVGSAAVDHLSLSLWGTQGHYL